MKKLRLSLDDVKIESFAIEGIPSSKAGTVRGRAGDCPEGGENADIGGEIGGCSCRCCACSCPCCCKCNCCGGGEN